MSTALTLEGRAGDRWRSYRLAGWLLRAAIFLAPLVGAVLTSLWLAPRLFVPVTAIEIVAWWLVLVTASSAVAWLIDRLARRLLPLSVMLRMTMLFPDRAPSRFGVALRSTNLGELRRRVAATDPDGETDLTEAAGLIMALASALNDYDRRLRGHGERTRAYADMLAEEMNVSRDGRDKLRWAALLHDIGKVEIPFEILNKDGPLDDGEMEIVRRHPDLGMRVAAPLVPWLGEWARAIEDHHEWWDGSGYPRGLAGEEISLGARIVAVADAFDVMTCGRQYQSAISPAAARKEVAGMAGRQFDPAVARALMNASLGRLRWSIGPLAWMGQIPFFLDRLGRDFLTVTSAAVLTAATVVTGIASVPAISEALEPARAETLTAAADTSAERDEPLHPGEQRTDNPVAGRNILSPTDSSLPADTVSDTTTSTPDDPAPTGPDADADGAAPGPGSTTPPAAPSTTTTVPAPGTTNPSTTTTTVPKPSPAPSTTTTTTTAAPNPTTTTTPQPTSTTSTTSTTSPSTTSTTTSTTTLRPPNAVDDTAGYHPGGKERSIDVLANDTHPDGTALDRSSVTITEANFPGVILDVRDGVVTYRMNRGTTTTHRFVYRVCDVKGLCDTATVTLVKAP